MRQRLQSQTGFTDAEISQVREVALGCNDAYDAKTRAGMAEVRRLAGQYAPNGRPPQPPPPAVVVRINALEQERINLITDCVASLKRSLGAVRFANLDDYVRDQGAGVRYVDLRNPDVKGKRPPPGIDPGGVAPGGTK